MDIGTVKFIRSGSEALQPYIKGYYVHQSDDPEFASKVTFYQNITTTISIYKDSVVSGFGRRRIQSHKKDAGYLSILAGLVDKYQQVEFYGPLDRVAIVFYPLGLNHFIREPLSCHLEKHFSIFKYFEKEFNALLPLVYGEKELEAKRNILDGFFINEFKPFSEPRLVRAVELLVQSPDSIRVGDVSKEVGASRRTLLRLFRKHLGYSIEEYRSVIKFRKALIHYQDNKENPNLADIAYQSTYYDQPDFNHQMKTRSGLTPRELFNQLQIVDDVLFWNIPKD